MAKKQAEKETRFYIEVTEEDRTAFKIEAMRKGIKNSPLAFKELLKDGGWK